jgi:muramoyltetrapeptide carboxypeptidase
LSRRRIHLIAHANPVTKELARLGFRDLDAYLAGIRTALPDRFRLTASRPLLSAAEDEHAGGRRDDAARIRDLNDALADPATTAIVAANGGAWFSRILPHVEFSPLARRRSPIWALGFSEMTTLVNIVASYPRGRGVYWLCPNYVAWKVKPLDLARREFDAFWRTLPQALAGTLRDDTQTATKGPEPVPLNTPAGFAAPITATLVRGRIRARRARLIGGCISVLTAMLVGKHARRLEPAGRWLLLEDINEAPYRIDRHLAALKHAGWLDRVQAIVVGDFHTGATLQTDDVLALLKFHVPARVAILRTAEVGHVWPMSPAPLNRWLSVRKRGRSVWLGHGL